MMVKDAIHNRFSCRAFSEKAVPHEILYEILEDSLHSPSCENSQPWEIYVAGPEAMKRLRAEYEAFRKAKVPMDLNNRFDGKWTDEMAPRIDAYFDGILGHEKRGNLDYVLQKRNLFYAPTMVFLCLDEELPSWSLFDSGIFAQSFMLLATEHGLATMASAVSVTYPDAVRKVLQIPENKKIVIGIGIGYPDEASPVNSFRTDRKGTDDIHYIL